MVVNMIISGVIVVLIYKSMEPYMRVIAELVLIISTKFYNTR